MVTNLDFDGFVNSLVARAHIIFETTPTFDFVNSLTSSSVAASVSYSVEKTMALTSILSRGFGTSGTLVGRKDT